MQSATIERRLVRLLVVSLLLAAAVRIVASVVSGVATLASAKDFTPGGHERAGQVLSAFGSAGDSTEAILLVATVALLWRGSASAASAYRSWLKALAVATVVLIVCRVAGIFAFTAGFAIGEAVAQQSAVVGFALADIVIVASVLATTGLLSAAEATDLPDDDDPVLFAIDRKTGEVFAFFSAADARGSISTYSIEDNEYDFYDDDGRVVETAVDDGRTSFTTTDVDRREELLSGLRRFAAAKSLDIDDPSDPLAYVQPINEWQWLELWPGWMRGIGRLLSRMRRPARDQVGRSKSIVE